jgi:4'-phosphopantetheinyl transferase
MELCLLSKDKLQRILHSRSLSSVLSERELQLYKDLPSLHRKRDWLGGRVATKLLLNKWLRTHKSSKISETEIEVCNGVDGRPYIVYKGSDLKIKNLLQGIDISISHHGGYALSGLTVGNRIGIDVSTIRPVSKAMQLFFLNDEELSQNEIFLAREDGAITCWAIKEAYVKALGKGFTISPKSFQLFIGADKKATIEDQSLVGGIKSIYFKRTRDVVISAVVIQ